MSEEKKKHKQLKPEFATNSELPILFVNAVNVRAGLEEFFFTVGTATPPEVKDVEELERLEALEARPYFRFAVTRTVMRQLINIMEDVYNNQTQQIDVLHQQEGIEKGDL